MTSYITVGPDKKFEEAQQLSCFQCRQDENHSKASSYRDSPAENLHEVFERRFVVWIDEDEILSEQEANDVVVVPAEHRDAAEPALEDHRQGLSQHQTIEVQQHEMSDDRTQSAKNTSSGTHGTRP